MRSVQALAAAAALSLLAISSAATAAEPRQGGTGAHPEDVLHMKRTADRLFGDKMVWSVLGAGRNQLPIAAMAAATATIGICMREIPNPAQKALAGSSSFIAFIVPTV